MTVTRVFTLEIACEGEAFHDDDGVYKPWLEIRDMLERLVWSSNESERSELRDSRNNIVGYTMMHEI